MSSAELPHPIVLQLEAIEGRLGRIENVLGIEDKPKMFIRKRTLVMLAAILIFATGLMWGVNYVINDLLSALPGFSSP
ncbi:MAG: hypothetical protein H8D69_01845 [Chloroflexi bacterium]|nr:hypothetical protein [Chloroflexota bacterium]